MKDRELLIKRLSKGISKKFVIRWHTPRIAIPKALITAIEG